jgi:Microtubule-binding stalk of dynein motor
VGSFSWCENGEALSQVDAAVESGREDEEVAAGIKAEVEAFQAECAKDLAAAEPVIAEAEAALNSLDKASLGELKSFGSPAAEVVQVSNTLYHPYETHQDMISLLQPSTCTVIVGLTLQSWGHKHPNCILTSPCIGTSKCMNL